MEFQWKIRRPVGPVKSQHLKILFKKIGHVIMSRVLHGTVKASPQQVKYNRFVTFSTVPDLDPVLFCSMLHPGHTAEAKKLHHLIFLQ